MLENYYYGVLLFPDTTRWEEYDLPRNLLLLLYFSKLKK